MTNVLLRRCTRTGAALLAIPLASTIVSIAVSETPVQLGAADGSFGRYLYASMYDTQTIRRMLLVFPAGDGTLVLSSPICVTSVPPFGSPHNEPMCRTWRRRWRQGGYSPSLASLGASPCSRASSTAQTPQRRSSAASGSWKRMDSICT